MKAETIKMCAGRLFHRHLMYAAALVLLQPNLTFGTLKPFEEIKRMANEERYKDALAELDKIQKLNPDSDAAKRYDLYDVAMLAADCQLRGGTRTKALKAADAAIDAADSAGDQDRLAHATVLYVLIDRAKKDDKYIPRTGDDRQPIDILTDAGRESAAPRVLADELDAFRLSKWKAAANFSLTPAMAAARHFAGVRAIEHLVTKATVESDRLGLQASKDIHDLVINWIKDRNHDLDRMSNNASALVQQQVIGPRGMRTVNVPAGLGVNRSAIQDYVTDCKQMPDALQAIDKGFGGTLELDGIYRAADDLKQRAQGLLDKYPN